MATNTIESTINHPFEDVLGIETGSTLVVREETLPAELVQHEQYDDKDHEIENQLEIIYSKAITEFQNQANTAGVVEGKYKARNAEVAAVFLNTALAAVKEKVIMKQGKDRIGANKISGPAKTINNNTNIYATREQVLKMMRDGGGEVGNTYDAEEDQ